MSTATLPAVRFSQELNDDAARLRVVVDQVASLTDRSVLAWYADLCA